MAYNPTTGIITAPVSIRDVQRALGSSSPDLGTLCKHQSINPWAKCKPIVAPSIIRSLDYAHAEQVTNYHCGLDVVYSTSNFNDFLTKVRAALSNPDYSYQNDFTAVKYTRPTGGMAAPFRLTDFQNYKKNAILDYTVDDSSAGGDGLPIQSVYSRNIQINLVESPGDVTLPDDSSRLAYYINHMAGGQQIAAREYLHVLDLIYWQLQSGIVLTNLRRGILIMNYSDQNIYRWTSQTIPWATDPEWATLLGSSSGERVWVVEFYTNLSYVGGGANLNGRFFCIPNFSYPTTCITLANFSGSYPASVPSTPYDTIEVFLQCDAPISTTFAELYIELQIERTMGSWESVTTITVKNQWTSDIRSYYENVYGVDDSDKGKNMRIRIYGMLTNSSVLRDFYYSESVIIS